MKPTPKELLELYQTATESLEEMFRKYELTIAEQAEKIEEQVMITGCQLVSIKALQSQVDTLKDAISARDGYAILLNERIVELKALLKESNPELTIF